MPTQPNAAELKAREQATWTRAAQGWRKHDAQLMENTRPVAARMLARLDLSPGMHVLDLASGTGEPAISEAHAVGPTGRVVGTDFVPEMIEFAREKAARDGLRQLEFRVADAETLALPGESFDAVSMRFGLMFVPDPEACLRLVHAVLKPGGRIAVACWGPPDRNPWAAIPMGIVRRHLNLEPPPPGTPGIFAMADPARLRMTLEHAGFHDVQVEPVDVVMSEFETGREFFDQMLDLAGPIVTLFRQLPPDTQSVVAQEIAAAVSGPDGRVRLAGLAWVASGR